MKATFIGHNASGYFQYGALVFPYGEPVEVTDPDTIRRLVRHRDFECEVEHPSLFGKKLAELREIAAAEGVNVADGAKAKEIAAAIKAARG